jgi:hypothetical protein
MTTLEEFVQRGRKAQAAVDKVITAADLQATADKITGRNQREHFRRSRVINREYCREFALEWAKTKRHHKFTRVSDAFLNAVEKDTREFIRYRVDHQPSKGMTLK